MNKNQNSSDGTPGNEERIKMVVERIMAWVKREFPSSSGGHRLYEFAENVALPTGEQAKYACVIETTMLFGEEFSRAVEVMFTTGLTSDREICRFKLNFFSDDGSSFEMISVGDSIRIGSTTTTNFKHYSVADDAWKLAGLFDEISSAVDALFSTKGKDLQLPHPLLPGDVKSIQLRRS